MDNMSGGMKSLCDEIIKGYEQRKSSIKELKGQVNAIRGNARKFLTASKKSREQMSKALREGLREGPQYLVKNVNALREGFREKEKDVKTDLAEASKSWNKMNEILRSKKTKSKKGDV